MSHPPSPAEDNYIYMRSVELYTLLRPGVLRKPYVGE